MNKSYAFRLLRYLIGPLALGLAIGVGIMFAAKALFGDDGAPIAIAVVVVAASIWLWRQTRWLKRTRAAIEADRIRLEALYERIRREGDAR